MSGVPASRPLLQPISSAERVQYIDVLRGFALYGVLLANIIWMAHDIVLTPSAARQLPTHAVDRLVKYLVVFFVDGKFVTLFSFLFAVGFTIQMRRALQRGGSGIPMYARRAAVLMVIGVVHLVFVWFGDILFAYGLLGFVLLSMRNWRPGRPMLVVACLLILFTRAAFFSVQNAATHGQPPQAAASHPSDETQQRTLTAFQSGYTTVIRQNVSIYWNDLFRAGIIVALLGEVFGRFLLGLYVGRLGYIYEIEARLPVLRRVLPWLLVIGVLGNGASVASEYARGALGVSGNTAWLISLRPLIKAGVVCLAAFYAACIALLLRSARWAPVLGRLAPVGRMALTNYLTQSLVFLFVLTGAGLGLIGHIGAAVCFVITLVLFGLQIAFSNWWLRYYRFGPAEWIWRSLTYGQMQPMRLDRLASAIG
jgi:uncharacterized protein